jgi:hypothetical protein
MAKKEPADAQGTGDIGLYYVCYRLSMLGWRAIPTSRNARGIDIVAYSKDGSVMLGLQVKSVSRRAAIGCGSIGGDKTPMGDFWIVVANARSVQPEVYVLAPKQVRDRVKHNVSKKSGQSSYWMDPRDYALPEFRDAWGRLGDPGTPRPQSSRGSCS